MNGIEFKAWLNDHAQGKAARPLIMGILNITPDSFYDGHQYLNVDSAFCRAMQMIEQGVDIIDIGGESSRPGAEPVALQEELARVMPIITRLRKESDCCISLDTYKPEMMLEGLRSGVDLINDIYALQQPGAIEIISAYKSPVCLMHMYGHPKTMANKSIPSEIDIVNQVGVFFRQRIDLAIQAGVAKELILIDPGIGFGKTLQQNLTLINRLSEFKQFQQPILLGVSRKSMIGDIIDKGAGYRGSASLATHVIGLLNGAQMIRTHDVSETKDALQMVSAITGVGMKI